MTRSDVRPGMVAGKRVKVDMSSARASFPKDRWGLLSPEGVRLTATLEAIVDSTGFMPFVTEVRDEDVEIASSYYGDGMRTVRLPHASVTGVVAEGVVS